MVGTMVTKVAFGLVNQNYNSNPVIYAAENPDYAYDVMSNVVN